MNGLLTGFQALHETLRDNEVVTSIAEKFIRQYIILKSKEESLKKFDDKAYIPLSCRVKIDLKGSHRISKSDKFVTLRDKLVEWHDQEVPRRCLQAFPSYWWNVLFSPSIEKNQDDQYHIINRTLNGTPIT